jgi:hypothetical protein
MVPDRDGQERLRSRPATDRAPRHTGPMQGLWMPAATRQLPQPDETQWAPAPLHSVACCGKRVHFAVGRRTRMPAVKSLHHMSRGDFAVYANGVRTSAGPPSRIWRKIQAALFCRARYAAARSRPHCRHRQRPSRSSTCRFSGVSGCPLSQLPGMLRAIGRAFLRRSPAVLKHTTPLEWLQSGPLIPFATVCTDVQRVAKSNGLHPPCSPAAPATTHPALSRPTAATPARYHGRFGSKHCLFGGTGAILGCW